MEHWDPKGPNSLPFDGLPDDLYALFVQPVIKNDEDEWVPLGNRRRFRVGNKVVNQRTTIQDEQLVRIQEIECSMPHAAFEGAFTKRRTVVLVEDDDDLDAGHMKVAETDETVVIADRPSAIKLETCYMPTKDDPDVIEDAWPNPVLNGATHMRIGFVPTSQFDGKDRRPVQPLVIVPIIGTEG